MKIKITYRITSLVLAFVVFFSTIGYSINFHYCRDHLVSVDFLKEGSCCCKKGNVSKCKKDSFQNCKLKNESGISCKKDNCCHNNKIVINKSDLNATDSNIVSFDFKFDFSIITNFVKANNPVYNIGNYIRFLKYRPPISGRNLIIFKQTFLI